MSKWVEEVEERYHRPLPKLLRQMYNEKGKRLPQIARERGASTSKVYYWLLRYGLRIEKMALGQGETAEIVKKR